MDFLAVVSRPDFSTGTAPVSEPVGDYFGFRRLIARHPEWAATVVELNTPMTEVQWADGRFLMRTADSDWFDLSEVRTAIYLPICLEFEETVLRSTATDERWPQFATEQWRPISALFESRLDAMTDGRRCLNRPAAVRDTNNKLVQFERLRAAGFALPGTQVSTGFPTSGALAHQSQLVSKNVSEGGWKSPTEFSPARVVSCSAATETWPTMWQLPIIGTHELRCYVIGSTVIAVQLDRHPDVLDVRSLNAGRPLGTIVQIADEWSRRLVEMVRALGLDYAVIDAIPADGDLHVLEVNANGVWWFLPPELGPILEASLHRWIELIVTG